MACIRGVRVWSAFAQAFVACICGVCLCTCWLMCGCMRHGREVGVGVGVDAEVCARVRASACVRVSACACAYAWCRKALEQHKAECSFRVIESDCACRASTHACACAYLPARLRARRHVGDFLQQASEHSFLTQSYTWSHTQLRSTRHRRCLRHVPVRYVVMRVCMIELRFVAHISDRLDTPMSMHTFARMRACMCIVHV